MPDLFPRRQGAHGMTETFKDDPKTLVSTEWLAAHLKDADLRIFDASWFLPTVDRDPKAEFDKEHIPGARFFDIDEICWWLRNTP